MSRYRATIALCGFALLSGCGDEGGSPGPIATAPAPTPAPTPTPTPVASYDAATDFNRDRSFTAVGLRTVHTGLDLVNMIDPETSAIGLDFAAATSEYRVRYNGESASAVTVRTNRAFEEDRYRDDTAESFAEKLTIQRSAIFERTYAGVLFWSSGNNIPTATLDSLNNEVSNPAGTIVDHRLLFGAKTVPGELPTTSVTAFVGGAEITFGGASRLFPFAYIDETKLTVDWATRRITGIIYVRRPSGSAGSSFNPPIEFPFSATFSADGHITNTAAPSGSYVLADGYFYGPAGAEIGFVFRYIAPVGGGDPRVNEYIGEVLAKRS